jgi:hypothetical protein
MAAEMGTRANRRDSPSVPGCDPTTVIMLSWSLVSPEELMEAPKRERVKWEWPQVLCRLTPIEPDISDREWLAQALG